MNNNIINSLLKLFLTTDTNDFTDEQAKTAKYNAILPLVNDYKKAEKTLMLILMQKRVSID